MKKKTEKILACALALCLLPAAVAVLTGCGSPTGNGSLSDSSSPTDSGSLIGKGKEASSSANWWRDYIDLETAAETYTLKDAKAAGYVIISDDQVASGEDTWNDFVLLAESGTPAKIRIFYNYFFSMLSSRAVMNTYDHLTEVEFDGEKYISRSVGLSQQGQLQKKTYQYLMRYEGKPSSPWAKYDHFLRYVLVNDDTVTWEDIQRGILSSQSGDYISHEPVYTDLTPHQPAY